MQRRSHKSSTATADVSSPCVKIFDSSQIRADLRHATAHGILIPLNESELGENIEAKKVGKDRWETLFTYDLP